MVPSDAKEREIDIDAMKAARGDLQGHDAAIFNRGWIAASDRYRAGQLKEDAGGRDA